MDAGLLYLVWPLAPVKVAVLPSVSLITVKCFSGQGEELEQKVRLSCICSKAHLVFLPVHETGHWALLVVEQTWPSSSGVAPQPAASGPAAAPAAADSLADKTACPK